MSKDNSDSFKLSRRKALASMGAIGAAGALGIGGTYAQFTDTESANVTFTAGGVDGTLSYGATYNSSGQTLDADEIVAVNENQGDGEPVVTISLPDVKPGDYGSITFGIEVQNNPAWVASCLGIKSDTDYKDYEPEVDADGDVSSANVGPDGSFSSASSSDGEVAENLLLVPFYTSESESNEDTPLKATFFDNGWPNFDYDPDSDLPTTFNFTSQALSTSAIASSAAFWNSREGGNNYDEIKPQTLEDAVSASLESSVIGWGESGGGFVTQPVPEQLAGSIGDGCVFVDGTVGDSTQESGDDVGALQPGTTVYFGYDWHIPFGVGNEMQGDKLEWEIGFTFSQIRHTESAELSNIFAPGQNSPEDTES